MRGSTTGNALSSLTIQPLQRTSKGTSQPWSSGIVCTEENCSYKADSRTLAWLRELFDGLDIDRCGVLLLLTLVLTCLLINMVGGSLV